MKDIVLLSPINGLIKPASEIVRKLKPTRDDPTVHMSDLHREVARVHRDDFEDMRDKGVVTDTIADLLLKAHDTVIKVDMIKRLMVKFSLMVPFTADTGAIKYIVPSLLPPLLTIPALLGEIRKPMLTSNTHYNAILSYHLYFSLS